jgi:hypothetical protein
VPLFCSRRSAFGSPVHARRRRRQHPLNDKVPSSRRARSCDSRFGLAGATCRSQPPQEYDVPSGELFASLLSEADKLEGAEAAA